MRTVDVVGADRRPEVEGEADGDEYKVCGEVCLCEMYSETGCK